MKPGPSAGRLDSDLSSEGMVCRLLTYHFVRRQQIRPKDQQTLTNQC
ncbi:hypothetical protein BN8_00263 [Fibrisoma limi BUZ 3]|uniref:Uncharacterized protein n=1 Tax=Fibrisoma limi BUZ 3 TaxID=1185876 RepID=I2GBS0_9BACT|nr:hypothetical protein BN8_00263 [Fibrisoma limi BUZ 3]